MASKAKGIGKRSREPLTDIDPNAGSKKTKLSSDLHPEQSDTDLPSTEKSSSDVPPIFRDDVENFLFVPEEEDVEEVDSLKAKEQRLQFSKWFEDHRKSELTDSLTEEEQLARVATCHIRFTYMLSSLIETAKAIKREKFYDNELKGKLTMSLKVNCL